MFADVIENILRDQCTPRVVREVENGGSPAALWRTIEDAGFLELLAAEASGGAQLPLIELFPILFCLGRYAVPVPLGQSIVARALLGSRCSVPKGMITLATACHREVGGMFRCPLTPHGLHADAVIARDGDAMVLFLAESAQREASGVRGDVTATLTWVNARDAVRLPGGAGILHAFAAALHAALLSGAMARVLEMTLQYCHDRIQFGRPLGKFQAVQHQLAVMAEHTTAASIAAEAAFRTDAAAPSLLAAGIAKSRASEAAVLVASIAHALHGAIGVTEEYDLQLLTRRLHEWRMAHGSEMYWNPIVGQRILASEASLADFVRAI
jgi:acyl-CoA dehydrogenase